jgi:type IV secretory pathway VirB2 component (pilin)
MSTCSIIKNRVKAEIKEYAPAMAVVALMLLPQAAFAGTNPIEDFFNSIVTFFNSGFARTAAIIALIFAGLGALAGKLSWAKVGIVVAGVVIVFGAAKFVDLFIAWSA